MAGQNVDYLVQPVLLLKELVVYGAIVSSVVLSGVIPLSKQGLISKCIAVYILLLFVYVIVSNATLMAALSGFRTLFTPLVLMMFGSILILRADDCKRLLQFAVVSGIILFAFGLLESYLFDIDFWITLGMPEFNHIKGFDQWANSDGIAYSFFSYDLVDIIGTSIRRMASYVAEPIAFGHIMALCFCVLLYAPRNAIFNNQILIIIMQVCFAIGCIASLSKGAILISLIAVVLKMCDFKHPVSYLGLLIASLVCLQLLSNSSVTSLQNHSDGLLGSFAGHMLAGEGVGMGGNYAGLFGESQAEGSESFFGAMIVQIGFPGAVLFAAIFVLIFRKLFSFYGGFKQFKSNCLLAGPCVFAMCCLVESIMSESAVGFLASGIGFISLGIAFKQVSPAAELKRSGGERCMIPSKGGVIAYEK